jgi:hypothetical protein
MALDALAELAEELPADVERLPLLAELIRIALSARAVPPPPSARIFRDPRFSCREIAVVGPALERLRQAFVSADPEAIGHLYEATLDVDIVRTPDAVSFLAGFGKKATGSFYTPRSITERVVKAALGTRTLESSLRVCDPACGGAAFLLEVGRHLENAGVSRRRIVEECLYGVDVSPLAIAVAEVALLAWAPDANIEVVASHLLEGDAVRDFAWPRTEFDLVIGNPPWLAYAGRAAQPLEPSVRKRYVENYACFRGYPTLHGVFVEQAARLAPNGVVALVLPSPVADLAGYSAVRRVLATTHTTHEPLIEFGQDAFSGVTQPSFALVARPGADARGGDREWQLVERQRAKLEAASVALPEELARIAQLPSFPRELFGEMGFQSAGDVARTLFLRSEQADELHSVPLLEGRDIHEFQQGPPRLFLNPDRARLAQARTRLRDRNDYRRVRFVTRQTAKFPIAALHSGLPFRNTLLAGFEVEGFEPELVVALLNSTLYRALHIGFRRDARQAAFPQVKIAHLRALPRPPHDPDRRAHLSELTLRATAGRFDAELRQELDDAVFDLFGVGTRARLEITGFVAELSLPKKRAPVTTLSA